MSNTKNTAATKRDYVSYLLAWFLLAVPLAVTFLMPISESTNLFQISFQKSGDWLTSAAATFVFLYFIARRRNSIAASDQPGNEYLLELLAVFCVYISAIMLPDEKGISYLAMVFLSTTSVVLASSHIYTWNMFKASVGSRAAGVTAAVLGIGFIFAVGGLLLVWAYCACSPIGCQIFSGIGLLGVFTICLCLLAIVIMAIPWRSVGSKVSRWLGH